MKKIIMVMAAAAVLASCGEKTPMYFDDTQLRIYNDTAAEFDTLSYAVGMNLGLGMSLQRTEIEFDRDLIIDVMSEQLINNNLDYNFLDENASELSRFQAENSRPYHMAKQAQRFSKDTTELPSLYDEKYTKERVCEMYAYDYVNFMQRLDYPVNLHWVIKAIRDSEAVTKDAEIDSIMDVKADDVRRHLMTYTNKDFPAYNEECTRRWLAGVAQQKDIEMMVVEGDTLYYRINNPGSEIKPTSIHDTVAFNYDVYTRKGRLVESLDKRINDLSKRLNELRTEENPVDSASQNFLIQRVEEQLNNAMNLRIPLKQANIKGARYALQNLGEGGSMTIWIPSSLAYGSRGNRAVAPSDGIVMNVTLKSVTVVEQGDENLIAPGKGQVHVMPTPSKTRPVVPSPGTVVPVKAQPTPETK